MSIQTLDYSKINLKDENYKIEIFNHLIKQIRNVKLLNVNNLRSTDMYGNLCTPYDKNMVQCDMITFVIVSIIPVDNFDYGGDEYIAQDNSIFEDRILSSFSIMKLLE